ncbi:acyl-CoA dehydrogenase family protein [Novosphingobium profundi]|uniref:acyl-CoA dehydrogenase family protein n=1 Tax=Novosphingobium profundi TaxID=1774954 RepID=UPI001BDB42BA|nr:acyl-CoA dehydrogenase family protein [Novosphingobium profundi]
MEYQQHCDALARHLEWAPFLDDLAASGVEVDQETWRQILDEAAKLAEGVIAPLDGVMDAVGAKAVDGRVKTVPGHKEAWEAFAQGGWIGLPLPEDLGGMALPLVLQNACEEVFNRASPAFAMLGTPGRTAAEMLVASAPEAIARDWVPRLVNGEWGATICISEPDAGSDVGRIRTRAVAGEDGGWRISGEKCWISFGDHDLTQRIGHFMLARSSTEPGVRGLSLFLVPDTDEDGTRNGVFVRRIEEKLGLHGSPTCVMGFEEAQGTLIGPEGRGLQTLFHMMLRMRLSCGPQGIGVAAGAFDRALRYAGERKQGGAPQLAPVLIREHADVQRMLLGMAGRIEAARGVSLAAANVLQLSERATEPAAAARWSSLAQFLLPIAKDLSARLAFDCASEALQVFGGAGYTREWPIEQTLRDARVFAVFEGTSGIQATDMLHRRLWREKGEGLNLFLAIAREELAEDEPSGALEGALASLEQAMEGLGAMAQAPREGDAGALAFLDLCGACVGGWIALRLVHRAGESPACARLCAAGRFYLAELPARAQALSSLATLGSARLDGFAAFVAE